MKTVSIYWKNDSNELNDLPEAKVVTCGLDGMQVLGTDEAIEELADAVRDNPDKFEFGGEPRETTADDFRNAVEMSQSNWPEFGSAEEVRDYLK